MEEVAALARKLGERIAMSLEYRYTAMRMLHSPKRGETWLTAGQGNMKGWQKNSRIRNGKPDFGPAVFDEKVALTGATAVGEGFPGGL